MVASGSNSVGIVGLPWLYLFDLMGGLLGGVLFFNISSKFDEAARSRSDFLGVSVGDEEE